MENFVSTFAIPDPPCVSEHCDAEGSIYYLDEITGHISREPPLSAYLSSRNSSATSSIHSASSLERNVKNGKGSSNSSLNRAIAIANGRDRAQSTDSLPSDIDEDVREGIRIRMSQKDPNRIEYSNYVPGHGVDSTAFKEWFYEKNMDEEDMEDEGKKKEEMKDDDQEDNNKEKETNLPSESQISTKNGEEKNLELNEKGMLTVVGEEGAEQKEDIEDSFQSIRIQTAIGSSLLLDPHEIEQQDNIEREIKYMEQNEAKQKEKQQAKLLKMKKEREQRLQRLYGNERELKLLTSRDTMKQAAAKPTAIEIWLKNRTRDPLSKEISPPEYLTFYTWWQETQNNPAIDKKLIDRHVKIRFNTRECFWQVIYDDKPHEVIEVSHIVGICGVLDKYDLHVGLKVILLKNIFILKKADLVTARWIQEEFTRLQKLQFLLVNELAKYDKSYRKIGSIYELEPSAKHEIHGGHEAKYSLRNIKEEVKELYNHLYRIRPKKASDIKKKNGF